MERGVPQVLVLGPFVFLLYDLLAVSTYFHADVNKTLLISDADKWIDVEEKMQHTTFTIKLLYMILPGSTYQAIYIYIYFPYFSAVRQRYLPYQYFLIDVSSPYW